MTKPLDHALDQAHLGAINEMMFELDINPKSALVLIKIMTDHEGNPHHYILKYANGSRMVMPFDKVNERAQHIGTDLWDSGSGDCRGHCQECGGGCKWVPSLEETYGPSIKITPKNL